MTTPDTVSGDEQQSQEPEDRMEVDIPDCDLCPCTLRHQLQEITLIDSTPESGSTGSAHVLDELEPEPPQPFVDPLDWFHYSLSLTLVLLSSRSSRRFSTFMYFLESLINPLQP